MPKNRKVELLLPWKYDLSYAESLGVVVHIEVLISIDVQIIYVFDGGGDIQTIFDILLRAIPKIKH